VDEFSVSGEMGMPEAKLILFFHYFPAGEEHHHRLKFKPIHLIRIRNRL
jgi:hypothetical protein